LINHVRPPRLQYAVALLAGFLTFAPTRTVSAAPVATPRIGGLNFSSPVEDMVTSIYWNPAAIGLVRGTHVFLDFTARLSHGRVSRASIDPATGEPGAGLSFPKKDFFFWTPDGFGGVCTDLGSESVTIGVAVYTPFAEMERYGGDTIPGLNAQLRYHRTSSDWFNLYVTPVVGVKFHRRFLAGVGLSYVRSIVKMSFYRDRTIREDYQPDTPNYRVEEPSRSERVRIDATDNSLGFNVGLMFRLPREIDIGFAYRSKALGVGRQNVEAKGVAEVTRYEDGQGWHTIKGRGRMFYVLPDSVSAAVEWRPRKQWELDLNMEWLHFSVHKDLLFKMSGNAFRAAQMGNWDVNFRHHRGFNDVWRVQVGAAYKPSEKLKVGGAVMYESTAVDTKWVNASAIDEHKVDILLAVRWRPHPSVSLRFGYSLVVIPLVSVNNSGFHPSLTTDCVTGQVDIVWNEACAGVKEGKGLPTAAGDYWLMVHKIGASVAYHYW
jgi:long-subunit fatty acid transport protein